MKTYLADIIPKIQRFSKRLDDLTKLTNQHWVSINDINQSKRVYIFRSNNQLIISQNGIVEKGHWEYLGNQSLLLETKQESYLFKHGFFDENVIALKLDSTNAYAFFVNENKYDSELNNIEDILDFLEEKYLKSKNSDGLEGGRRSKLGDDINFTYTILGESVHSDFAWGKYIKYRIRFSNGMQGELFNGFRSGKYFYMDLAFGKQYYVDFEEAVKGLYDYLLERKKY